MGLLYIRDAEGSATPRKSVRDLEGFLAEISVYESKYNSGCHVAHARWSFMRMRSHDATMVVRDTFGLKIPHRSALCSYSRLSVCCVSLSLHLTSPR